MIKVLFFAQLSEIAKCSSLDVDLKSGDVKDLLEGMKGDVPDLLLEKLKDQTAMVSINQKYATWESKLSDGDEIGFLPPVSGG